MKDFFVFRTMITPMIVQVLFWMALLFSIIVAIFDFTHGKYLYGFEIIIFGPLLARILAELIMIFFRMNDSLDKIATSLTNAKDK